MVKKPYPSADPLGRRIAEACDSLGERQQAAEAIGVSVKHLRSIIQGQVTPGGEILKSISEVTGYSVDWLLFGEGEPKRAAAVADPELMAKLADGLAKVYSAESVRISQAELTRLATVEHNKILATSSDPGEWVAMVKLVMTSHRQKLQTERMGSRRRGA